jgi:hypothetical protein
VGDPGTDGRELVVIDIASRIDLLNHASQIVTAQSGNLLTPQFVFGARQALETARQHDIKIAVLPITSGWQTIRELAV